MIDEDLKGKYQRGLRAFRNKEYESAIEYFSEAVGYDENDHKAWNALGTACSIVGRHSDADLCYENALTIDPENETYLKNRVANAKKMKSPPPGLPKGPAGSFLDRLPFDRIPIDRTYLLAGIAIIAVIILGALLLFAFSQFSAPAAPPGPAFDLSVNQSNGVIYLTNQGAAACLILCLGQLRLSHVRLSSWQHSSESGPCDVGSENRQRDAQVRGYLPSETLLRTIVR